MCNHTPGDPGSRSIRLFVAVADSGHGMTAEEQMRIFERFSQASPKTYGEFGGHGLGLYISRKLVGTV
jgi:signal transduction histidine kinase